MLHIVLDSILRDTPETEQLDLLFSVFVDILDPDRIDKNRLDHALQLVDFLRTRLRAGHASQFNLAFRKFYNALHRLIIDANRDGSTAKLIEARRAILKLTGPDYGFEFLRNCLDESFFTRDELSEYILTLVGPQSVARLQPNYFQIH